MGSFVVSGLNVFFLPLSRLSHPANFSTGHDDFNSQVD